MWKKFKIYSIKKLVLVRKGRSFYATFYQEVFFTFVALSSPFLWLLAVTTMFTEGGLGVNVNLLNYPETVTPYHYNWAPLGGGAYELRPPSKGS